MSLQAVADQARATGTLTRALAEGRVASAYLFEGPTGVGKALAAVGLAEALLCPEAAGRGCGTCAVCRRIEGGTHPDVRRFEPRSEGAGNIEVEYLRETILPFTRYAPFEAERAVAIFPDADVSFPAGHPEAANALLKTLEEPRAPLVLVLTSARPERLLTTIRSRCQRVGFGRLSDDTLRALLTERGVSGAHADLLIPLADGRADVALSLAEGDAAAALLERCVGLDEHLATGGPGALTALADGLAKDDGLPLFLGALTVYYRDVAAVALHGHGAPVRFASRRDAVLRSADRISAAEAAERALRFARFTDLLDRNANADLALAAMLFEFRGRATPPAPAHASRP